MPLLLLCVKGLDVGQHYSHIVWRKWPLLLNANKSFKWNLLWLHAKAFSVGTVITLVIIINHKHCPKWYWRKQSTLFSIENDQWRHLPNYWILCAQTKPVYSWIPDQQSFIKCLLGSSISAVSGDFAREPKGRWFWFSKKEVSSSDCLGFNNYWCINLPLRASLTCVVHLGRTRHNADVILVLMHVSVKMCLYNLLQV